MTYQVLKALILRVDSHRCVSQKGFGTSGGHGNVLGSIGQLIPDVVEIAGDLLVLYLQIG